MSFDATYDACVLHPAGLRDFLVRLAMTGLFRAHWSEDILDEMVASILSRLPDLDESQLARTRELMCEAVPDSVTTGYEDLIEGLNLPDPNDRHVLSTTRPGSRTSSGLNLPDPNDRHVLAAAIRSGSQVIVTENIDDFPLAILETYGIEPQTPDIFVLHLIELSPTTVSGVIQAQATALKAPPMSVSDVLDRLARSGLPRSVAALKEN